MVLNTIKSSKAHQDDAGVQDETGLEILWLICRNSPGCLCRPQTDMWEETQSETSWEHNTHNKPRHNETTLIDTSLNLAAGLPVVASGNWLHRHLTASKVTISKHTMQIFFFFLFFSEEVRLWQRWDFTRILETWTTGQVRGWKIPSGSQVCEHYQSDEAVHQCFSAHNTVTFGNTTLKPCYR